MGRSSNQWKITIISPQPIRVVDLLMQRRSTPGRAGFQSCTSAGSAMRSNSSRDFGHAYTVVGVATDIPLMLLIFPNPIARPGPPRSRSIQNSASPSSSSGVLACRRHAGEFPHSDARRLRGVFAPGVVQCGGWCVADAPYNTLLFVDCCHHVRSDHPYCHKYQPPGQRQCRQRHDQRHDVRRWARGRSTGRAPSWPVDRVRCVVGPPGAVVAGLLVGVGSTYQILPRRSP